MYNVNAYIVHNVVCKGERRGKGGEEGERGRGGGKGERGGELYCVGTVGVCRYMYM